MQMDKRITVKDCNDCLFCEKHYFVPTVMRAYCSVPREYRTQTESSELPISEFGVVEQPRWCPLSRYKFNIQLKQQEKQ